MNWIEDYHEIRAFWSVNTAIDALFTCGKLLYTAELRNFLMKLPQGRTMFQTTSSVIIIALLMSFGIGLWAQQTVPTTPESLPPPVSDQASADATTKEQADDASQLRIGSGDLIEVRVFGVPDLGQSVRVNNAGEIYMPSVGPVKVAGLTSEEASTAIELKLKEGDFLRNPQVSIFTKEYATQGITLIGEVSKPGVYPILGERRLFDAISMAGGLTNRAGKLVTITHRGRPMDAIKVELSDPTKSVASNVVVLPGDTVAVGRAGVVYVVGDVSHPAGFTMENNERLTVLQAIALAGGANYSAALDAAKIIRRTPEGPREIAMPLKKILTAKAEDVPLQPEDVLFIPKSAGKNIMRRSAETVLQVTTGLVIYRR